MNSSAAATRRGLRQDARRRRRAVLLAEHERQVCRLPARAENGDAGHPHSCRSRNRLSMRSWWPRRAGVAASARRLSKPIKSGRTRSMRRRRAERVREQRGRVEFYPARASSTCAIGCASDWTAGRTHRRIEGRLVIATHNPGKLAEMGELLAPLRRRGGLGRRSRPAEPEETGTSFRANARIKAQAAAAASGLPALRRRFRPGGRGARRRARHPFRALGGPEQGFLRAPCRRSRSCCGNAAPRAPSSAARISSARSASPGPTAMSRNSRPRRRHARLAAARRHRASAMIRCSCPTATTMTFGEMPSEEKHGLPPHGAGLSHRARAFKLEQARASIAQRHD